MKRKLFALVTLLLLCTVLYAQTALEVRVDTKLPVPLLPGSSGSIEVRLRNALTPREPIQLQATATYEYGGQTYTVSSNVVTLRVIQPVKVRTVALPLPDWVSVSNSTSLPITVDRDLLEGEEITLSIPITLR